MTQNQSKDNAEIKKLSFLKRGNYWPMIIVGMLVLHASIILGTLTFISARHDLYVEPDYYAKSIDWDNQREMFEAADKMGWVIEIITGEPTTDADQTRALSVSIKDANGDPIDRALVELDCYHPAHASDRKSAVLEGMGDGLYQTTLAMNTPGYWNAHLAIRHQGMQAMVMHEIEIR